MPMVVRFCFCGVPHVTVLVGIDSAHNSHKYSELRCFHQDNEPHALTRGAGLYGSRTTQNRTPLAQQHYQNGTTIRTPRNTPKMNNQKNR
eukprot:4370311-Amphidinium_carterae.1